MGKKKKGNKAAKNKAKPSTSPKRSGRKSDPASTESDLVVSYGKGKGGQIHSSLPVSG